MPLETTNHQDNLTLEAVNDVLTDEWVAVENSSGIYNGSLTPSGFELFQGTIDEDGDVISTSDSLPVMHARNIGNTIRFKLLDGSDIDLNELSSEE